MVRTAVTLEVWNAVNTWYHELANHDKGKYDSKNLPQILDWIKRQVNLIKGTINNTQLLNDGFDFIYLGFFMRELILLHGLLMLNIIFTS